MRYEKGHKDATHQRILEIAAQRFRKEGVEAVGVAGLMADAGLTHGGFYSHFASKEELVREAVMAANAAVRPAFEEAATTGRGGLEGIIRSYLRLRHCRLPEQGCPAPTLAAEIARHSDATRMAFMDGIEDRIAWLAGYLPMTDPVIRRQRAIAIFSLLVGALQLARVTPDEGEAQRILDATADAAIALGQDF